MGSVLDTGRTSTHHRHDRGRGQAQGGRHGGRGTVDLEERSGGQNQDADCEPHGKVEQLNVKICSIGGPGVCSEGGYLKDMLDLNTELIGYLSSITDNVNVRALFDFLTICYCEYDHFFKD